MDTKNIHFGQYDADLNLMNEMGYDCMDAGGKATHGAVAETGTRKLPAGQGHVARP
jgi:hypothetical protein